MRRSRIFLVGAVGLLVTALVATPVQAKIRIFAMLELAEECDVAFVGKVTKVGDDSATVTVAEVLFGKLDADSVKVSPITFRHCIGRSVNFSVGEEVLVFGKKTDKRAVTVIAGGQGKVKLDAAKRGVQIAAAKRILAIAQLAEREKNKAMLAEVRSKNEKLRSESHNYIAVRLSHSDLRNEYKDELVALLKDTNPEIQRLGLQAIRFVRAEKAIPRIAELTKSEDPGVVSAASMALGQYDSAESVAALIALTEHKSPQVRIRACLDLDSSRRPEAKAALMRLLEDEDPQVRAMAPRGLVYWLRRNDAPEALPKLEKMLKDPDPKVRASASDKLGECRNSDLVPPLLDLLKEKTVDENTRRCVLSALYCHYSKGDPRAGQLIDEEIQLIVKAVKGGGRNDAYGSSFQAVGILRLSRKAEAQETLRWAARSHPNESIRKYAERCLAK